MCAPPRLKTNLREITSFHEACLMMGCTAGTRVVAAGVTRADETTRRKLGLETDEMVEIVRLRMADDLPVMLETNRFAMKHAGLLQADMNGSLYHLFSKQGIEAASGVHEISLCYANGQQARLLEVEAGAALLQLEQVIYDQHGLPLHTSHQVIRGDRFTFRI